jgi:hypothetical protein
MRKAAACLRKNEAQKKLLETMLPVRNDGRSRSPPPRGARAGQVRNDSSSEEPPREEEEEEEDPPREEEDPPLEYLPHWSTSHSGQEEPPREEEEEEPPREEEDPREEPPREEVIVVQDVDGKWSSEESGEEDETDEVKEARRLLKLMIRREKNMAREPIPRKPIQMAWLSANMNKHGQKCLSEKIANESSSEGQPASSSTTYQKKL